MRLVLIIIIILNSISDQLVLFLFTFISSQLYYFLGLLKALTTVTSSCEDQAAKDAHWNKMLQPLIARYNGLISRPDLKNVYNDHKFRHQLVSIMECFIGCVQGSHMVTCSQLYNILQPVSNILLARFRQKRYRNIKFKKSI